MRSKKINIKELILLSFSAVIIFICKLFFATIPNIEPVTLLLIILTCILGKKAFYIAIVYVMLEIMIYGLGFWVWGYLFLWPFLVCLTALLRREIKNKNLYRAVLAAFFGLFFDLFYALIIGLLSGLWVGVTYYASGIVFSTVHMIGNYFLMMILGERLYQFIDKLYQNYIVD